ncbi:MULTISPECIES: YdgH/BhsA/McbA-like domain containing protein [unclassified Cedecea]|uniref:YdgH/BhsA/McbA-like domain containing protein n=1 Tax=unclassified Cedecea TaxID=2649846 RepID=UPI003018A387
MMRKLINSALALTVLTALSGTALAATEVQSTTAGQRMGYVSVTGATTLDEAVNKLADKASQAGATTFKVTSAGGNNKLYATAILFK